MISVSSSQKKIAGSLVLIAFLALALLSMDVMPRGSDGRMEGNCPFSATGASLCSQDTPAAVVHHISAYETFLNVPAGTNAAVILFLLIALGATLLFSMYRFAPRPLVPSRHFFQHSPPASSHRRKITRWLSLFENSPSFA